MSNIQALRLNAYTVTGAGHILCSPERRPNGGNVGGHEDEFTSVLRIDLERDTPAGRDIVSKLIETVDEPRALLGTAKNGSVVLLFRRGKLDPAPNIAGQFGDVFKLSTCDGAVRFSITCASAGQTLDPAAYTWLKGRAFKPQVGEPKDRSPLEIGSWTLPLLTGEMGKAVIEAAFKLGCAWASTVEDDLARDKRSTDIASGKIKLPTEEELQAVEDAALVKHYEGREFGRFDDIRADVHAARRRHAIRQQATTVA